MYLIKLDSNALTQITLKYLTEQYNLYNKYKITKSEGKLFYDNGKVRMICVFANDKTMPKVDNPQFDFKKMDRETEYNGDHSILRIDKNLVKQDYRHRKIARIAKKIKYIFTGKVFIVKKLEYDDILEIFIHYYQEGDFPTYNYNLSASNIFIEKDELYAIALWDNCEDSKIFIRGQAFLKDNWEKYSVNQFHKVQL